MKRIRNPGGKVGRPSNPVEKFESLIEKGAPGECWRWKGVVSSSGYGFFKLDGKQWLAHRLSVILLKAEDPSDKVVRHTCDNPICVNPDHLLVGTTQDNVNDRVARNRSATGERNFNTKLTPDQVRKIRSADHSVLGTGTALAIEMGVTPQTIHRVKMRKCYRYVPDVAPDSDHPKEDESRHEDTFEYQSVQESSPHDQQPDEGSVQGICL